MEWCLNKLSSPLSPGFMASSMTAVVAHSPTCRRNGGTSLASTGNRFRCSRGPLRSVGQSYNAREVHRFVSEQKRNRHFLEALASRATACCAMGRKCVVAPVQWARAEQSGKERVTCCKAQDAMLAHARCSLRASNSGSTSCDTRQREVRPGRGSVETSNRPRARKETKTAVCVHVAAKPRGLQGCRP